MTPFFLANVSVHVHSVVTDSFMDSTPPSFSSMGFPRQEHWSRLPFPPLFYLNYPLKDPQLKHSDILRSWELGVQHVDLGSETQFSPSCSPALANPSAEIPGKAECFHQSSVHWSYEPVFTYHLLKAGISQVLAYLIFTFSPQLHTAFMDR